MAEEENDTVTYTVKITVTLTIPYPETQPSTFNVNAETMPLPPDEAAQCMDVVAETLSLSDAESLVRGDDVTTTEESDTDKGNQDMDIGDEIVSLKDNEGSTEDDDIAPVVFRKLLPKTIDQSDSISKWNMKMSNLGYSLNVPTILMFGL
ncbi:unnamed protein product [Trifolium pratense]|uniref:Uncharacterized protein n=1 Tax=Trifolium pratense TaxID=57577 RepID=A0ACB0LC54_TRIPR|nr:unnamed protein product [Trifolium pratense]